MVDPRRAFLLVGESLRDIGILLVMFGPLDTVFHLERANPLALGLVVTLGLLFMAMGIIIESTDQERR